MSIRPLPSELQEIAEKELGEVPERVQEDVQHIREWLTKQPHLRTRTDDQWILTFLRGCKFSLQRTKEKIDLFCTMRTLVPEFFANRDPFLPEIQDYLRRGVFVPLPNNGNPKQPVVALLRTSASDPEKTHFVAAIKCVLMITDILLKENDNMIVGQHLLLDLEDMPFNYIKQMTPATIKKLIICLQNAFPTRLKGFHHINTVSFYHAILNTMRLFFSEKIKQRLLVYDKDNMNELYRIIPRKLLPNEYGGEAGSIDKIAAEWKLKVESYREWFLDDEKYRSDESKRPGKPITSSDIFGVEGSFRKLDVD